MPAERSQREVERPRSGRFFYLAAVAFAVATFVVVGLWVGNVLTASRLQSELEDHLEKEDYRLAVEVMHKLIPQSPRLKRPNLQAHLGKIRIQWAEFELSQGNFKQASAQAALAAEDDLQGDQSKRVNLVKAGAAIGQLKQDLPNLTFDERLARCRSIIDKYSGTDAASESAELFDKYERISHAVRKEWEQLTKKVSLLKENGRIPKAIKLLQDFRGQCDKDLLQELVAELGKLNGYIKTGYCELQSKIELTPETQLPPSSARILVVSRDFLPLFRRDSAYESEQTDPLPNSVEAAGDVFFSAEQGILYCMSTQTGQPLWAIHQGLGMGFLPARSEGDAICASDWGKTLSRLNSHTGEAVWSVALPVALACRPLIVEDEIVTLDQQGHLRMFDLDSGRLQAERELGGQDLSDLVTDSHLRLIAVGAERAVLFEKAQDTWLQLGSLLTSEDHVEKVYLVGRYICLLPRRPGSGGRHKRSYLWRDRSITLVETPDIENDWHLLDQKDDLQIWVNPRGIAHYTQLKTEHLETPLVRAVNMDAFNIRDARLVKMKGQLSLVTAGVEIQLWNPTGQAEATSFKKEWSKQVVWRADYLRVVGRLQILKETEGGIIVRGDDRYGPVFARLNLDAKGEIEWMSRLGPNAYLRPVVFNDLIAWPDGGSGLVAIDAANNVHHVNTSLFPVNESRGISVEADEQGCLAYTENELMLFGEQLNKLWKQPAKTSGRITTSCLLKNAVIVVTEQGKLLSYDRLTGEEILSPTDIPDTVSPCTLLVPADGLTILLVSQDGAAVKASIAIEGEIPKWSFQDCWDSVPAVEKIVADKTGIFGYTPQGWLMLAEDRGPFALGLRNLLYVDESIVLAGDVDSGDLACVDLGQLQDRWHSQTSSPAMWAGRAPSGSFLVLTRSGRLLLLDSTTGSVINQKDCLGSPTATPAISGGHLWIPLSGYRLLKVSLAEFDSSDPS